MTRAVELFSGGGGVALAFRDLGIEVEHVEIDSDACATLRAAGFDRVHECDVREWRGGDAPAPFFWCSTPCQPFSSAGKRLGAEDPRNMWPATFEQIDRLRPVVAVAEQVPGLVQHSAEHEAPCRGCYFDSYIWPNWRQRFPWSTRWTLMAADFGTPQTRKRVFLIGAPAARRAPEPTHRNPGLPLDLFKRRLPPWVSIRQALGLGNAGPWVVLTGQHSEKGGGVMEPYERSCEEPAPTVRGSAGTPLAIQRPDWWHRASDEEGPARAVGTRGNATVNLPSPTVSGTRGARGGKGAEWAVELVEFHRNRRTLTVEEVGVLQDFPADWPWQGETKSSRFRQAGNACPRLLSRAVIRAALEIE